MRSLRTRRCIGPRAPLPLEREPSEASRAASGYVHRLERLLLQVVAAAQALKAEEVIEAHRICVAPVHEEAIVGGCTRRRRLRDRRLMNVAAAAAVSAEHSRQQ